MSGWKRREGVNEERESERHFVVCKRHVGCCLSNLVVLVDLDNSGQEEEQQCQDQHDKVVVYKIRMTSGEHKYRSAWQACILF